ncbi:MAG: preQ(1) synthase [Nitrospinota bacterium]
MSDGPTTASPSRPLHYTEAEFPEIECVPNAYPDREYSVNISIPEFTCLCPVTGLPDFAEIRVEYVPGEELIELKSLKYYILAYRNVGIHHESTTNKILDDLVAACTPRRMEVTGDFSVRGGIKTVVRATYHRET